MKLLIAALFTLIPVTAYSITPQEVSRLVVEKSLEVKISKESLKKAELVREATKRAFLPQVNLSASYSEFFPDFKGGWNQNYSLGATVSAEPINFQRFVKLKVDSAEISIKRERLDETILEQLYQALKELYTLKAYQERIEFKEEALKSAREILGVAKEKYRKGLVMITDLLKARAEVERVKGELSSLKAQYRQTFNRLNELLDFSLKEREEPEVNLKRELPHLSEKKLLKEALKERPQVKRAREEVKEASLQVEYAKRSLSPFLTVNLSWSRSGTTFWPNDRSYSAGVTVNFPIFDSGLTTLKAMEQERDKRIALLNLKKTENAVKREVLDALSQVEADYQNLKSDEAFLRFSQKAYDRALNEYRLGVSDIVALLQAYSNLKEAQERFVSSLLSFNLSLLSLKRATGELLKEVKR